MTQFKFNDPTTPRFVLTPPESQIDVEYMKLMQFIKDNSKAIREALVKFLEKREQE